jgi:tRNA-dihydrouridine synthase A
MKFAVAPMIDWSDSHCRFFHRLISKKTWLFSEMITTPAILLGDKNRLLKFVDEANKTALQLGGSNPKDLAKCAKIGVEYGYSHINLNVGCPSDRVQQGSFGAVLMKTPQVVADCFQAMQAVSGVEVSIKHRIGVDNNDSYEELVDFIGKISDAGCKTFIIHARKAWLQGLSPKENRSVPPLKYDKVYQIKQQFPGLNIIINGGIKTYAECKQHLTQVDGVMLGREIYHNPYFLAAVDNKFYAKNAKILTREEILDKFISYMQNKMTSGVPMRTMSRHILGLYYAQPQAKRFKRMLSGKVVNINELIDFVDKTQC